MDYGSHLKDTVGNKNTQSKTYKKQSAFKGSDRAIRGKIIRLLTLGSMTQRELHDAFPKETRRLQIQLSALITERLVVEKEGVISLP